MSHVFEITEEDIRNGVRGDPKSCPLANALKRHYRLLSCEVHNDRVDYVNTDGTRGTAALDPEVASMVAQYDEQGKMNPLTLYNTQPDPVAAGYQYPKTRD